MLKSIIKRRSIKAKKKLAEAYLYLIEKVAKKYLIQEEIGYLNARLSFRDAVEEGAIGLFRAVDCVQNKSKKMSFVNFAQIFIEHEILGYIISIYGIKTVPMKNENTDL